MTETNASPNLSGLNAGSWLKWVFTLIAVLICLGLLFRSELDGVKSIQVEQTANVSKKIDAVNEALSKKIDVANEAVSKKIDAANEAVSKKIDAVNEAVNESVRRVDNRIGILEKNLKETPLASRRYAILQQRFEAQGTALQQRFEQQGLALQQRIETMVARLTKEPALVPAIEPTVGTAPRLAFTEEEKAQVRHSLKLEGPPSKAPPKYALGETVTDSKQIPDRLLTKLPKLKGFRLATDPNTGSALFVDTTDHIIALVPKAGPMN
jgi:hypothetical protein